VNKVVICGVDTSTLPRLTHEQTNALLTRVQFEHDTRARDELIEANLRLVLSVLQRFAHRQGSSDDMFQVGCVGLIKAIDNFDTRIGVRFSTYAVPMIIGEIRRYLRDNNPLRVSRSLRDLAYKALLAREELIAEGNENPRIDDIARKLEVTPEEIGAALDAVQTPLSLHEPLHREDGDELRLMDSIPDGDEEALHSDLALSIAMDRLAERERTILNMRYLLGHTQMEVAAEIGISQAQVSRLEKTALHRLRRHVE